MWTTLNIMINVVLGNAAFSDTYRVTYTSRGLVQRITVQAESTQEARRVVQALWPGSYVTDAHKVR